MLKYLNDLRTTLVGLKYIGDNIEIPSEDVETFEAIRDFAKEKFCFLFFEENKILKHAQKYIEMGRNLNNLRDKAISLCDTYVEKYFGDKIKLLDEPSKISLVATSMLYSGVNKNIASECHNIIMKDAMEQNGMYLSKYRLLFAVCFSIYQTKLAMYTRYGLPAVVHLEKSKSIAVNTLGSKRGIQAYALMCTEDEYRNELFGLAYDDCGIDKITRVLVKTIKNQE